MTTTISLYQIAYYARDLTVVTALGAFSVLVIIGFFRASRGLSLRNNVTAIGFLALLAGTLLCTVPIEMAFFLSRRIAVEILVASVVVWLFSLVIQGYYGS